MKYIIIDDVISNTDYATRVNPKLMTDETKQEVAIWEPLPFEGSDLLPLSVMKPRNTRGRENIRSDDLIVPVLKILNGMSDEVTEQSVEGAVPGMFLHSGAQEVFRGPIRVLVCAHTRSRALFPDSKNYRFNGLEKCISRDSVEGSVYGSCDACRHTKWGEEKNEPPLCSESHNFTVLTSFGPAIIRMARRSRKSANNFLTTWNFGEKDLWTHPVVFSTKAHQDDVGDGKKATNYSLEMKWLQKETVPPAAMQAAEAVYNQVTSAHEQGKFKGDDESDSDIPF